MLELDRLQRTRSTLGPLLRGKMRWVAADANRCDYGRAYAEADLRRAGLQPAELARLTGDFAELPEAERAVMEFARKMTLAANTVTDAEVARLIDDYGEANVTAMVVLLAYANFQDRLLLALDLPVEEGGPLPPLDVRFVKGATPLPSLVRTPPPKPSGLEVPERIEDSGWLERDFDELQQQLAAQRANAGRIRVPSWDLVKDVLPPGYPVPKNPSRVRWTLVCMGYQPALSAAWLTTMRTFGDEAKQDRVFEESLFWVVTRSIDCFY
jgi:hypothetical protein